MPKHATKTKLIKRVTTGLRAKTKQEILYAIQRAFDKAAWIDMKFGLLSLQTAKGPAAASNISRKKIKVGVKHQVDLSVLPVPVRRGSVQDYKHRALSEIPMAKMKKLSKRRKRSPLQIELIHLLEIIDELDMPSLRDIELRLENIFDFDIAMDTLQILYNDQKWNEIDDVLLYLCDTFNVFRAKLRIPHTAIRCNKRVLTQTGIINALLQTPTPLHKVTQRRLKHIKGTLREGSPEV